MPRLGYAAGRLGSGSDVLGLDDTMSRDHDWGCRLTLLVDEAGRGAVPQIAGLLERELPASYRGHPVRFPVRLPGTGRTRLNGPGPEARSGTALLRGQRRVEPHEPHGVCLVEFGDGFP